MSLDTNVIQQYYAGILRLTPSAATINAYAQLPSYEAAMDAMMNAAVSSVNPITKLYQAAFDRVPDSAGLTNYTAAYGAGAGTMTLQQIANQWTGTIEFTTDYPASMPNADYVGLLYWNVLHRAADPVGAANFTAALNSGKMTRADVLLELSQSPEFAFRIDGHIRGFQEQCALNDPAAYTGTLWDKVPPGPGETFTLTTGIDTFTATTDNATFNAVTGDIKAGQVTSTLNTGDILTGASGVNTLSILGNGNANGNPLVQTTNVQNVTVRSVQASTVDQLLMNNVALFSSDNSLADTTVVDASTATVYGLNNTINTTGASVDLTVSYTATTGKADASHLAINNAGGLVGSTVVRSAITADGATANTIEAANLATAGDNIVTLNSGTGAKSITITGSGNNDIVVGSANATLLVDASATTGDNVIDVEDHLSGTSDTIKGGSGADVLVANINNTTASTVTGVETLALNFAASANYNGVYTTGVTELDIANDGATGGTTATLTNIASTVDTLTFDTTASAASTATSVAWASGTNTDVTVNVGQVTDAGTSTTITAVGALTLSNNAGTVTVNSISDKATTINTIGALKLGTATGLTVNTDAASLTVGAVTGTKATTLEANTNVAKGSILVGGFDDALALTSIAVAATSGNVDLSNGGAKIGADGSLSTITMSAETVGATVYTAHAIIGEGSTIASKDYNENAILTASGSGVVNVETSGAHTFIGTVDATGNTGAVNLDFSAYTGADATKGFTISLGDAVSTDNNSVNVSKTSGDSVITGGAGADSIIAGNGSDLVDVGAGADTVVGNGGNDIVTLGAGSDTFVFANQVAAGVGAVASVASVVTNVGSDIVSSYVVADDVIQLSTTVFGSGFTTMTAHYAQTTATNVAIGTALTDQGFVVIQNGADAPASIYYVDQSALTTDTIDGLGAHATLIGTLSNVTGTMAVGEFAVIS